MNNRDIDVLVAEKVSGLEKESKQYKQALENIKNKIKSNDNRIGRLSKEPQYYDQSKKIERLHGEALGLETALNIIDNALKGESEWE